MLICLFKFIIPFSCVDMERKNKRKRFYPNITSEIQMWTKKKEKKMLRNMNDNKKV